MKSQTPKVLHRLAGRPMLAHLLATLEPLGLGPIVVVTGEGMEAVAALTGPHKTVVQRQQLGTGHAVLAAKDALGDHLGDHRGDVLVLFGADPLIRPQTIDAMLAARRQSPAQCVACSAR